MESKREVLGYTKKGTKVIISTHAKSRIVNRLNKNVQDIFRTPHSYKSMLLNIANRAEKRIKIKNLDKLISGKETFIVHIYCRVNEHVLEQAMIFSYSKINSELQMVIIGYCWQIVTKQRFYKGKHLYKNLSKLGLSYTAPRRNIIYFKMPRVSLSCDEEITLRRDYHVMSYQSRIGMS